MSETPQPKPPAGWYPHPRMADTRRYWDGEKWTDHIAPGGPVPSPALTGAAAETRSSQGLEIAGVVMMVIFPIGGFIAGCVLLGRRALAGTVIMLLSVASMYVWYSLITADDGLDCSTDNLDRAQHGLPLRDCG